MEDSSHRQAYDVIPTDTAGVHFNTYGRPSALSPSGGTSVPAYFPQILPSIGSYGGGGAGGVGIPHYNHYQGASSTSGIQSASASPMMTTSKRPYESSADDNNRNGWRGFKDGRDRWNAFPTGRLPPLGGQNPDYLPSIANGTSSWPNGLVGPSQPPDYPPAPSTLGSSSYTPTPLYNHVHEPAYDSYVATESGHSLSQSGRHHHHQQPQPQHHHHQPYPAYQDMISDDRDRLYRRQPVFRPNPQLPPYFEPQTENSVGTAAAAAMSPASYLQHPSYMDHRLKRLTTPQDQTGWPSYGTYPNMNHLDRDPPKSIALKRQTSTEAVLERAAESRARNGLEAKTTSRVTRRGRAPRTGPDPAEAQPGDKITIDTLVRCDQCGRMIARLILKGTASLIKAPHQPHYSCRKCEMIGTKQSVPPIDQHLEYSYLNSFSMAVDKYTGTAVDPPFDDRPSPAPHRGPPTSAVRKTFVNEVLTCDVCQRDTAAGSFYSEEPKFDIETICVECDSRYQRCTDCGGGGRARIGVGRWRCKELFPEGRKTCQFSHVRLATLGDMLHDVVPIADIPPQEIDLLVTMARDLYYDTVLSVIAVPHMIESSAPMARSFLEVEKLAVDSWTLFEPYFRTPDWRGNTKTYLGMRWCQTPSRANSVKSARRSRKKDGEQEDAEEEKRRVIRPGKTLSGFVLAELCLSTGSLYIILTVPVDTGEADGANTKLMRGMTQSIIQDIKDMNQVRVKMGEKPYPNLIQAWTMLLLKKDSRPMSSRGTRLGYSLLPEYLKTYSDTPATDFAPEYKTFLPKVFQKGFSILVRRIKEGEEWSTAKKGARRSRKAPARIGDETDFDQSESLEGE